MRSLVLIDLHVDFVHNTHIDALGDTFLSNSKTTKKAEHEHQSLRNEKYLNLTTKGLDYLDEPDVEVNATESTFFLSLKPGETVIKHHLLGYHDLHPETVIGDTYRYQY